jgi:transposase-like protein
MTKRTYRKFSPEFKREAVRLAGSLKCATGEHRSH